MASSSLSFFVATQHPTPNTLTNPFKRDKPVLKDTACGQQTRFYSNGPSGIITLKRWRPGTALYHRYVNLLQARGGYTIVWRDTDHRNEPVDCEDIYWDCSAPDIPDDLGKTFIQVRGGAKPKITITLYFHLRRKTGGTCLVQGHNKDAWVVSEYESLCTFVQQLKEGCADPADNVPVDMPSDRPRQLTPSPLVTLPDTPPRPSSEPEPEDSANTSHLPLELYPLIALDAGDCSSLSPAFRRHKSEPYTTDPTPESLTVTAVCSPAPYSATISNQISQTVTTVRNSPASNVTVSGQTTPQPCTPPASPGGPPQHDYCLPSTSLDELWPVIRPPPRRNQSRRPQRCVHSVRG